MPSRARSPIFSLLFRHRRNPTLPCRPPCHRASRFLLNSTKTTLAVPLSARRSAKPLSAAASNAAWCRQIKMLWLGSMRRWPSPTGHSRPPRRAPTPSVCSSLSASCSSCASKCHFFSRIAPPMPHLLFLYLLFLLFLRRLLFLQRRRRPHRRRRRSLLRPPRRPNT